MNPVTRVILAFAFGAALCGSPLGAQTRAPALFVPADGIASLHAGRHEFSSFEVAMNGRLHIIPGSRESVHIVVHGDAIIDGFIFVEGFSSDERQHEFRLPSGQTVVVTYRHTNRGGDGGDGDMTLAHAGGRGAEGTVSNGGGGGAGAANGAGGGMSKDGLDATGRRGGAARPTCGTYGGNGGPRHSYATGGTLYLEVHGNLSGTGRIFLRGGDPPGDRADDGIFGQNQRTMLNPVCEGYPGGGGGGAPGNPGGHVVGWVKGRIFSYPSVSADGEPGGRGGAGGERKASQGRAATGGDGERGLTGTARWFNGSGAAVGPETD